MGFYPEGGELVPGVLTRVYAEVTDTLGRPTDATGRVVDEHGRIRAHFATEHQGRGSFELVAEIGERLRLEFDEPFAEPLELPVVPERAVGLHDASEDGVWNGRGGKGGGEEEEKNAHGFCWCSGKMGREWR